MQAKRSIIDYLADNAARHPDRVAAYHGERKVTFRELEESSARCRGALAQLGVKPGDRVALVMSDCPEMMVGMLGVMGAGAVDVPCSTMLKPNELEYMLQDSAAKLVVVTPEHAENAKAAIGGKAAPRIIVAPAEFNALPDV
jgi:long-chain acyl-CoA synthetase